MRIFQNVFRNKHVYLEIHFFKLIFNRWYNTS